MKQLLLTVTLLFVAINVALCQGGDPPFQPHKCCQPSTKGPTPAALQCDEECFFGSSTVHCGLKGQIRFGDRSTASCVNVGEHQTSFCQMVQCTLPNQPVFTCRQRVCGTGNGQIFCFWDPSGFMNEIFGDCNGDACGVGQPAQVACDNM